MTAAAARADEPPTATDDTATPLQQVHVAGARDTSAGFSASRANASTTKSNGTLFETPQAITVLTRELLDARAVTTLNEAIGGAAGVSSGSWGKRGWDDFTIRGQRASESIRVDGLKLNQSNYVAQEVFGVDSIEILKGPASINFGSVQPGGIVNLVSKRPRADPFNEVGLALGNYNYKQATFDLGRPLGASGKAAFRIDGLWSYTDDQTNDVYFKNQYLAPSLSLDLGSGTDFTILGSYTYREYLRNQGVPYSGTYGPNRNGKVDRALFVGDPSSGPYRTRQSQIGYNLVHRFDSGWTLTNNFRWQQINLDGDFVQVGTMQANQLLMNRSAQHQQIDGDNHGVDVNLARSVDLGAFRHGLLFGVDNSNDKVLQVYRPCTVAALNVFKPVYGAPYSCAAVNTRTTSTVATTGLYGRDQLAWGERWRLSLAVRHDRAKNLAYDGIKNSTARVDSSATTGSVGLQYELTPYVAPYASFATSFLPVSGTDFFGTQFKPEKGRQTEIGAKFQAAGGRINGSLALYDLTRKNVTTADPDPAHIALQSGAQVQTGEQRTKGLEAEIGADLRNGWSVQAGAGLLDGHVTKDNGGTVGKRLLNAPRQSASVLANYRFTGGMLVGWGVGAGLRYESDKTGPAVNYTVAGYTVADASVSYAGSGYRVSLNVKNLFDRDYYAGVLNANVLPLGDPRTAILKLVVDF